MLVTLAVTSLLTMLGAVSAAAAPGAAAPAAASGRAAATRASTPVAVPITITGVLNWTVDEPASILDTTPGYTWSGTYDQESGTLHIDLAYNAADVATANHSTYSFTDSFDDTLTEPGGCTITYTASDSGKGKFPLKGSVNGPGITIQTSPNPGAQAIGGAQIPFTEPVTTTYGGPPATCLTGSYPGTQPQIAGPHCQVDFYAFATGPIYTYPDWSGPFRGCGKGAQGTISGHLTIGCGNAAATAAGASAEPSACGLTITSPPADKVIALTDGKYFDPQPGENGRQPDERTLKVEGTAPAGTTSVTLNDVKAELSGDTWKADLPVTTADLGELTLTASDGKVKVKQKDTLIDIEITKPTEDADEPITAAPAMPVLDATLSVLGYSGDTSNVSFDWTLQVRGETVHRPGVWDGFQMPMATGSTKGPGEAWEPSYEHIVGGIGRLSVTADLPGVLDDPVTSEPRWIRISGTNPPAAVAKAYVDANDPQYADTIRHIVCHESAWNQFNSAGFDPDNNGQPPIPDAPDGWKPNPGTGQPLYGKPAGIGISQQDPEVGTVPLISPDEYWDWQANLQAGIAEFHRKLAQAEEWTSQEQKRLDDRLTVILTKANANRVAANMPTITETAITVPELTDQQVIYQAIRYYNGQYEYHFDADYVLSANGFDPVLVGQQRWLGGTNEAIYGAPPSPAGHWGATPSNLHLARQWVPYPSAEAQAYVDAVRTCHNS